ncbi:hypothetical protein [Methanoregula sp.]|uniref:hypothetical protein n=1 Tax=Methanoregula sp. TaxID=2052170 RepID=UPI003565D401
MTLSPINEYKMSINIRNTGDETTGNWISHNHILRESAMSIPHGVVFRLEENLGCR